jgi:hypothetical protein
VVTFSYESNARRDVPISPKIYRIRTDLSWREVVENAAAEKKFLNGKKAKPTEKRRNKHLFVVQIEKMQEQEMQKAIF